MVLLPYSCLWIFFYLNKLLYFISLIILKHSLPCITEGIGHSLKNNYTSGKQERDVGRDKEIMHPLRMRYFLYVKRRKGLPSHGATMI